MGHTPSPLLPDSKCSLAALLSILLARGRERRLFNETNCLLNDLQLGPLPDAFSLRAQMRDLGSNARSGLKREEFNSLKRSFGALRITADGGEKDAATIAL